MNQTSAPFRAQPNSRAIQACTAEFVHEAPSMAARWVAGVSEAMRQQEAWSASLHEKNDLAAAIKELQECKTMLETRWVSQLKVAIGEALQNPTDVQPVSRRSLNSLKFEELELMDDVQVQATVQVARLEQLVQGAAGDSLAELSALLSRAQGFGVVKAEYNPYRPDVVIKALREVMDGVSRVKASRNLWLQHGTQLLGQELLTLYRHLIRVLADHGVQPAGYSVIQSPKSPVAVRAGSGATRYRPIGGVADQLDLQADRTPPPPTLAATPSQLLTLDHLHQLLVGDDLGAMVQSASVPLHPNSAAPALPMAAKSGSAAVLPVPIAGVVPPGNPSARVYKGPDRRARRGPLPDAEGGADPLRALASEVVHLMLDGMTRDARLLPPVRQVLTELQPALQRIAQEDPRFFADRLNPARRLLDEITQRSLAFVSERDRGFDEFLASLNDVVQLFSRSDARVTALFETALEVLEPVPSAQSVDRNGQARGRAVASLVKAEQRFMVAEIVSQEIRARKDFEKAPAFVKDFVLGPWSQVIAQARLEPAPQSLPPGRLSADLRYRGVLTDLLWSSRPELSVRNRGRLVRLIPGLLRTLREGLQTIDLGTDQSSPFFSALMALHEEALKVNATQSGQPAAPEVLLPPSLPMESAVVRAEPARAWLRPSEVADTGFMDEPFPELHLSDFPDTQPQGQYKAAEPTPATGGAPSLPMGAWIELEGANGGWIRMQLTWASPHGTMYMFTGANGQTSSMTRRSFDNLWFKQRVRLVAERSVVDDALDTVMDAAVLNSTRTLPGALDDMGYTDLLPPLA
jgi:hypothetical protein